MAYLIRSETANWQTWLDNCDEAHAERALAELIEEPSVPNDLVLETRDLYAPPSPWWRFWS